MVRLSVASGYDTETLRRWFGRLRRTRPVEIAANTCEICVHCSLLLAMVGANKVVVVSLLLSIPVNRSVLVAFLVTLAVYNHNKLTDLDEDSINAPEQAALFGSRTRFFALLSVTAYVMALGLSVISGPVALGLALFPGVIGVLYSTRWLPVFEADRLKDVLVVGTSAVAIAWAVPLALLPLAFEGAGFGVAALVVLTFFFLRTAIAVELFNIRDVEGDRREGVCTLPVVLGTRRTQWVLGVLNGCSLALLVFAVQRTILSSLALAVTPAIAYSLFIVVLVGSGRSADRLCLVSYVESPLMAVFLVLAFVVGH
jgi:4-hydroxybenzoate polyprenyltransferase